jgi:AraC-like DNA-binding protein
MDAPSHILAGVLPVEQLLFASDLVCAGLFRCQTDDPAFAGGQPSTSHCIVFPRTAVWIQHEGGRRFVADPSIVALYNRNYPYRRWKISQEGDRSDWLAFPADVILDAVTTAAPGEAGRFRADLPFRHWSLPVDARLYAAQRRLFGRLEHGGARDALPVEELALRLLDAVVRRGYGSTPGRRSGWRASRDATEHVRQLLARNPGSSSSLRRLAAAVGWSPCHLCREFRRNCGMTLTAYRNQIRLRTSLDRVGAGEDLAAVAFDLGFSSHSHFTLAFRKLFGSTPSKFRTSMNGDVT